MMTMDPLCACVCVCVFHKNDTLQFSIPINSQKNPGSKYLFNS